MTLSDQLVYGRGYNRKVYVTPDETFEALLRGEVDAVVMESPLAGWFVTRNAGFVTTEIGDPGRDLQIGAAIRKADLDLKASVDRAIQQLAATTLPDRKSTRLNSSHDQISYAVFCLKKKIPASAAKHPRASPPPIPPERHPRPSLPSSARYARSARSPV